MSLHSFPCSRFGRPKAASGAGVERSTACNASFSKLTLADGRFITFLSFSLFRLKDLPASVVPPQKQGAMPILRSHTSPRRISPPRPTPNSSVNESLLDEIHSFRTSRLAGSKGGDLPAKRILRNGGAAVQVNGIRVASNLRAAPVGARNKVWNSHVVNRLRQKQTVQCLHPEQLQRCVNHRRLTQKGAASIGEHRWALGIAKEEAAIHQEVP